MASFHSCRVASGKPSPALTLMRSALYGVSPADLHHSAIATLILVGCILAAGYLPARRASRIEPMEALRHE